MTTAGPGAESQSLAESAPMSRAAGWIWATNIIHTLAEEDNEMQVKQEPFLTSSTAESCVTEEQQKTFSEFAREVYERLFRRTDRFAHTQSFKSVVPALGTDYIDSFPGADELGPNVALHGEIRDALAGKKINAVQLNDLYQILVYRMTLMGLADWFVQSLGIKAPGDKLCAQWDFQSYFWELDAEFRNRFDETVRKIFDSGIFGAPTEEQGEDFAKPDRYVAAAIQLSTNNADEADRLIQRLLQIQKEMLEEQAAELWEDTEVRRKRRRLLESVGRKLRSPSPSKRQSLGYPTTQA